MLIEFIKKPNFYDDIETRLYGTEYNDKIIYKIGIIDFGMIMSLDINESNFAYLWLDGIYNKNFNQLIDYIENKDNHPNIFINTDNIDDCIGQIKNLYNYSQCYSAVTEFSILVKLRNFTKILDCVPALYNYFC